MATLLLAEHDNSALNGVTAKALTAAAALGGPVHILVAGKDARGVADAAAKLSGVEKVLLADDALYCPPPRRAAGGAHRGAGAGL